MKLNAKYVTFSMIAMASTYVLYHNERFLADSSHPVWQPAKSGLSRKPNVFPLPMGEG
jgi:hypothetical protein